MKKLTANFFPAHEPKNGFIGMANITVANAMRLNGISVFDRGENGIGIAFPGYGEGENARSYVVPQSKEAYAAMCEVVAMAVSSENHFGYNKGDYGVRLEVSGKAVQEPYADARFHCQVGDVCTLYGISTREVSYEKDGATKTFVSVDMPNIGSYDKDGEKQYRTAFEGRKSTWTDKDGKEASRDYAQLLTGLVLNERKEIIKEKGKSSFDDKLKDAEEKHKAAAKNQPEPSKDADRGEVSF